MIKVSEIDDVTLTSDKISKELNLTLSNASIEILDESSESKLWVSGSDVIGNAGDGQFGCVQTSECAVIEKIKGVWAVTRKAPNNSSWNYDFEFDFDSIELS